MHTKKYLRFIGLRKLIFLRTSIIKDKRQDSKIDHTLHDCCQNAFAMMFFQNPSMKLFQERYERYSIDID